MKQQEVFKKIGVIIKELGDQYEYLKTAEEPLNELELELFLANSHFLTDHLLILSKLNAQLTKYTFKVEDAPKTEAPYEQNYFKPLVRTATPEPQTIKEENIAETYNEPIVEAIDDKPVPSIELGSGGLEDRYSFTHGEEPETIRHELVLDEADWDEEEETLVTTIEDNEEIATEDEIELPPAPARHVFTHEPERAVETEVQPLGEKETVIEKEYTKPEVLTNPEPQPVAKTEIVFEPEKPDVLTINERISAQMTAKQGVGEQFQPQTITDLKQAINLNDKLLFIKDLFNGYSLAYSEAIEILNRFTGFDEADQFLKRNYVIKNQWESKSETTAKFYALLKRRYA
jgi:hypothetical protein